MRNPDLDGVEEDERRVSKIGAIARTCPMARPGATHPVRSQIGSLWRRSAVLHAPKRSNDRRWPVGHPPDTG